MPYSHNDIGFVSRLKCKFQFVTFSVVVVVVVVIIIIITTVVVFFVIIGDILL